MPLSDNKAGQIILYEGLFNAPGRMTFSQFSLITRYCLNRKGLPFTISAVEMTELPPILQELRIEPCVTEDGRHTHTFPAIYDPSTDTRIADTVDIAEYLDGMYPEHPRLMGPGTKTIHKAFTTAVYNVFRSLYPFIIPPSRKYLTPAYKDFIESTKTGFWGVTLHLVTPQAEKREEAWEEVKARFDTMNDWFEGGTGVDCASGPFFAGKEPTLPDFHLAGRLTWAMWALGEESPEWQDIRSWNGGRWGELMDEIFVKYRCH